MLNIWFWGTLGTALVDWIAVAKCWKRWIYLAKPATMIFLLAWLVSMTGIRGPIIWFALGILFSLGGDVALMLPREQFILGLISFLLAHIAYIVGFNLTPLPLGLWPLLLALFVLLAGYFLFRRLSRSLRERHSSLIVPVLVYAIVISLMLLSALLTFLRPDWQLPAALLVSIGALLFYISDTTLAWGRFVHRLPFERLLVIVTYHLGQIAIIAGTIVHYG